MASNELMVVWFLIGVAVVGLVVLLAGKSLGIHIPSPSSMLAKEERKELKSKIVYIPEDERPRIVIPEKSFDKIVEDVIVVGRDTESGLDILQFRYEDKELSKFTVLDDPVYIRYVGSFANFLLANKRKVFRIVLNDALTRAHQQRDAAELFAVGVIQENKQLRKVGKEAFADYADTYSQMKKGMFGWSGQSGQQFGSGFRRPWMRPSFSSPMSGGGGGGMDSEESMM